MSSLGLLAIARLGAVVSSRLALVLMGERVFYVHA